MVKPTGNGSRIDRRVCFDDSIADGYSRPLTFFRLQNVILSTSIMILVYTKINGALMADDV